jgi:tetratricopeptide (TPR) repeat protein
MKRVFYTICIFMFTLPGYTKTYADMFNVVYRNKLYYSSYVFLKKSVEINLKIKRSKSNKVMDIIHPSVFIHDPELDNLPNGRTGLDYAIGIRRFFLNDFETAEKKLKMLRKKNPMRFEASYILGLIHLRRGEYRKASTEFKRCVRLSKVKKKVSGRGEQYINTFKNRCVQQVARVSFSQKKYKESLKFLNFVEKDDYIWPRFIIDKAWNYYWNGENERALGSVMTYKAPLLRRFMTPEANYLKGLIYYEMCYYEKAEKTYKEFNRNTWKYRNVAKTASRNRLLRLILSKRIPTKKVDKFLYYYLKGFKKDIRFFTYKRSSRMIQREIKKLSKVKSLKQARVFLDSLYYYQKAIRGDFQDFLKNISEDYYHQISEMRSAFVKLNLMVSLQKRQQLSKGNTDKLEDTITTQELGDIANVSDKFIWDFRGGFWADELGDYAVALRNRCKK